MKLILFDCDGTLVDSAALIHEVMARTFVQFGHSRPDLSSTKSIIGLTLDIAIARMQGKLHVDDEAIAMTAHYKSIYTDVRQEPGMDVPLFAGIKAMIDTACRTGRHPDRRRHRKVAPRACQCPRNTRFRRRISSSRGRPTIVRRSRIRPW